MKHKLFFSGQEINLDQTHDAIKMDLQKSIDRFFPTPNEYVVVDNYDEPDTGTLAIHITRMYSQGKGAGLKDFICDQDESLISGLPVAAF